jgi:hypothetical protein
LSTRTRLLQRTCFSPSWKRSGGNIVCGCYRWKKPPAKTV